MNLFTLNSLFKVGGKEEGRVVTPAQFLSFNFFDMKRVSFKFGNFKINSFRITSLYSPYKRTKKTFQLQRLVILKLIILKLLNLDEVLLISKEYDNKKWMGMATRPKEYPEYIGHFYWNLKKKFQ